MEDVISRAEHNEFEKRIVAENSRQNNRIRDLEDTVKDIKNLTVEVSKLATNMGHMLEIQKEHGNKLDELESKDGEMWRKIISYTITAMIGIIVGVIFKKIGF